MYSVIELKNVTKRYGKQAALDDVSFDVSEGSICGLIGPNGAGKTTLFNCLSRLLTPQQGAILFDGENVLGKRAHSLAGLGIAPDGLLTLLDFGTRQASIVDRIWRMHGDRHIDAVVDDNTH